VVRIPFSFLQHDEFRKLLARPGPRITYRVGKQLHEDLVSTSIPLPSAYVQGSYMSF
jgi:hypothetical protein